MNRLIIALVFLCSCYSKKQSPIQSEFYGKVIKVIDGDTYDLLVDTTTMRIRMDGIDAPERGMPFYKVAKEYLGDLCVGQNIKIITTKKDRYKRFIANSYLENGSSLSLLMVKAGMAWHFKKYSNDVELSDAELEAKSKRIGLWFDENPTPPWEWRANRKNKINF